MGSFIPLLGFIFVHVFISFVSLTFLIRLKKYDGVIFVVVCNITSLFWVLTWMMWWTEVAQVAKIGKSSPKLNICTNNAFERMKLAPNEAINLFVVVGRIRVIT